MSNICRFIFVTRHLNRSGYLSLKEIIRAGYKPLALIVTKKKPLLVNKWLRPLELLFYWLKCKYYRCEPIRMTESEELYARHHNIKIISINSFKETSLESYINNLNLDLIVVAGGWHERIPVNIINKSKYGAINVHPSLLPEFRGTSITRWQIYEGANSSGVTIHYMDEDFDTGKPIAQIELPISKDQTPQDLFQVLSEYSAKLLVDVINNFTKGIVHPIKGRRPDPRYDHYYPRWKWSIDCLILDPGESLERLHYKILASTQESYEYPGPLLSLNNREFIIRKTELHSSGSNNYDKNNNSSNMLKMTEKGLAWSKSNEPYILYITQLQPSGRWYKLKRANFPNQWFKIGEIVEVRKARATEAR